MVCRGLLLKVLEAEPLPLLVRPSTVRGRLLASEAQILPYCSRRLTTSSIKGGKALQNRTKAGNTGGKSCCLSSEVSTVNNHKSIKIIDKCSLNDERNKLNRESNATTMMDGNKASFVERISNFVWFKVTKIDRSYHLP